MSDRAAVISKQEVEIMGVISRGSNRLPGWAQAAFVVLTLAASVYSIAHYLFWSFLLRFLFSPNL
jgi:hypothetical protein